jgi:hypothetical protein
MSEITHTQRTAGGRLCRFGAFAVLVGLAAGCNNSTSNAQFVDVEGVVTLDGKPLPEVEVQFLPDPDKGNAGPSSSAYTDAKGHFKLHCEQAKRDGAVVGTHRVRVIDITSVTTPANLPGMTPPGPLAAPAGQLGTAKPAGQGEPAKPSRVPAAYTNAADTPIRQVLRPGKQTIDLQLTSQTEEKPAP